VLNVLFGTLHDNNIAEGKFIIIGGNPGAEYCDRSIATGKGWSVFTYVYEYEQSVEFSTSQ
jgi:hypothetical protein